uniref:Sm domain-containing protein n=1 Tax=Panagrellus redivivus TaxID=6233 RepID=A0A7E4W2G8_PANRE
MSDQNSRPSTSTAPKKDRNDLDLEERQKLLGRLALPDAPRNIQRRVRERTLAAICKPGTAPTTKYKAPTEAVDPIGRRLQKFITDKAVVMIRLRNRNHFEEPNRNIMGVITAADHHWNLLVVDADEVYTPAAKLGVVQSYEDQTFPVSKYDRVEGTKRQLTRSLGATMILGHNIVHISEVKE